MFVFLSPIVLLFLALAMAAFLIWGPRSPLIPPDTIPWATLAMAFVALAMGILLVAVPGSDAEQALRVFLLLEGCLGVWLLRPRKSGGRSNGRG
ncbi:MAG: hypothetical protein ACM3O7_09135 [Acidobacteriota bacterium]